MLFEVKDLSFKAKHEDLIANDEIEQKLNFMYSAIQDTQETIKFTDTKSGTVVVIGAAFITAIVTLVDKYINLFNNQSEITKLILIVGSSLFCMSLFVALYLSLKSINPSNNPNEHVKFGDTNKNIDVDYYLTGLSPKMRFRDYIREYKDSKLSTSVSQYYNSIRNADSERLLLSLTYEFIKLSYIKDKKHKRTQCALKWLGTSFFIVGFTVILFITSRNLHGITINELISKQTKNEGIYWLVIIYFAIRLILAVLSGRIRIKNSRLIFFLNNSIYTMTTGFTGYLLGRFSILDIVIIFLTSVLFARINFIALFKKLHLPQSDNNTRLFSLLDDFLHIGILFILSVLKI